MKTTSKITKTFLSLLAIATLSLTGCSGVETEANAYQPSTQAQKNNTPQTAPSPDQTQPQNQSDVKAANADNANAQGSDTSKKTIISKVSEEDKQVFLDAINAARADTQDCGDQGVFQPAPALTWNDKLGNAAYEHSNDMAKSDTFSHDGSGTATDITAQAEKLGRGSHFTERIDHHGYTQWRTVGENIAAGYRNAEDVVTAWIKSPHHCANLMNPKFSEVGMALVIEDDSKYYQYWTQEFGGE